MTRRWRGKSQGGISIALLAKHKRKDQLIDKVLIRAFDFNDRSVKVAAAPPPSARTFEKWSRVSLHERFHHSAFVSVSWYHLELSDKSAKVIPKFCQRYFSDSSHFEEQRRGFIYLFKSGSNERTTTRTRPRTSRTILIRGTFRKKFDTEPRSHSSICFQSTQYVVSTPHMFFYSALLT